MLTWNINPSKQCFTVYVRDMEAHTHFIDPSSLTLIPRWSSTLTDSLCVMGIDRVEELLQFVSCQDSIREVGLEFVKGELPIVCWRSTTRCQGSSVRPAAAGEAKWPVSKMFLICITDKSRNDRNWKSVARTNWYENISIVISVKLPAPRVCFPCATWGGDL